MKTDNKSNTGLYMVALILCIGAVIGAGIYQIFWPIDIVKCEGEPVGFHICVEYANGTIDCGIPGRTASTLSIITSGAERKENVVAMYLSLGVENTGDWIISITDIEFTGPWASNFGTPEKKDIPIGGTVSYASDRIDVSSGVGGAYGAYNICANITWAAGAYTGSSMECKSIYVLENPTLGIDIGWGPI